MSEERPTGESARRQRWHEVIFESDTPAGKQFDVLLLLAILASVLVVMLDSVERYHASHEQLLYALEWTFTILFTIEYVARLACVRRPLAYATSFFGIIDLLAILPTFIGLALPPGQTVSALATVRTLRLLRVFRVLKLVHFLNEFEFLGRALKASARKITVFIATVLIIVVIVGSLMYMIEGRPEFPNIPESIYWAIVTLTTVGYGDMAPSTALGKALASFIMILGYGIIAVPTGIVSVELANAAKRPKPISGQACPDCAAEGHDTDAEFCKHCGARL